MRARYNTDYFFNEIKNNPNYNDMEILTKEINKSSDRVFIRCKKCGYEWDTTAHKLIWKKTGCGRCHGAIKFTNDFFVERVSKENPDIVPLDEYIDDRTPINCQCKKCGNVWSISPTKLHQGEGCPVCAKSRLHDLFAKNREEFIDEMKMVDPTIRILSDYKNNKTDVACECTICGNQWGATPSNLLRNRGCPSCNSSYGEKRINLYLSTSGIKFETEYEFNDCIDKRKLPFDFYLPDYNIAIEYDGIQHYEASDFFGGQDKFEYTQRHDKIKTEYCKKNHIKLIRIPYYELENISNILKEQIS